MRRLLESVSYWQLNIVTMLYYTVCTKWANAPPSTRSLSSAVLTSPRILHSNSTPTADSSRLTVAPTGSTRAGFPSGASRTPNTNLPSCTRDSLPIPNARELTSILARAPTRDLLTCLPRKPLLRDRTENQTLLALPNTVASKRTGLGTATQSLKLLRG